MHVIVREKEDIADVWFADFGSVYDSDAAGQKASQRAIGILERLDMKVRVLHMEGAKDPDEFIRSKGPDAFRALLEGSEDQVDWRLNAITAKYDLHQPDQKVAFLKEATEMVAALPGQVEREVYAIRVAGLAEVLGSSGTAIRFPQRPKKV